VHVPAAHTTPVGGAGHGPQVTAAQKPAQSGFMLGCLPSRTEHRSRVLWLKLMAVGHEQHATIDVASVQSPSVLHESRPGGGHVGQQYPGPRSGSWPSGQFNAGHVSQMHSGQKHVWRMTSLPSGQDGTPLQVTS
jgi:hypothetical protein